MFPSYSPVIVRGRGPVSIMQSPSQVLLTMRSPGPLLIVSSRGPRSNTRTASPYPVRSTTSTAAVDLHHFHHYCYAERNGNTRACSADTSVVACLWRVHNGLIDADPLILPGSQFITANRFPLRYLPAPKKKMAIEGNAFTHI